jgi:hypothetical protein
LELELQGEDVARFEKRNGYLEGELKLQERHRANALKNNIALKQRLTVGGAEAGKTALAQMVM